MNTLIWTAILLPAAAMAQETPLQPFSIDHRAADASSVNLSFLLDAPAGKNGYLQVRNGHIAAPDGKPFRLWGVDISDFARGSIHFPEKADAAFWAATLARFGVNCVRMHAFDCEAPKGIIAAGRDDTREFDAAQMDRLDAFIAELKKHGIYCDLNLNVSRSYKAGDGVRDYRLIGSAKALTYFDPRLIELQKEYARKLLTHYNPYTKAEYRNEPAIAIIEMVNENSLVGAWDRGRLRGQKTDGPAAEWQDTTPYYAQELTGLYHAWLARKGMPAVPRLEPAQFAAATKERFETELSFYMETERNFFRDMQSLIRGTLGSKSLLVGTSDFSYGYSSLPMLTANSLLDIIDTHGPWELRPMVNEPLNSIPVRLSRSAMAGKPLMVSEHNHRFPNDYISEGIPLLAAYASFQDWDAIFLYTFELKPPGYVGYNPSRADLSHDPVKLPNLAAGALLFLRSDVDPARETVARSYTAEQVMESLRVPASAGVYFTPDFTPSVALRHGSRIRSLDDGATQKLSYPDASPIVSDTKELSWYVSRTQGMVSVDTPRTQALIGFVPANPARLTNFSADIRNPFASVVLTSLDANPIARATHLLLCVTAREGNTHNGPPTAIQPVTGTIALRGLEKAVSVELAPLDGSGRPAKNAAQVPAIDNQWQVDLHNVTTWYLISVRR